MDLCKDAKCLVLCYEENEPGKTAGEPVFARYGVRSGVQMCILQLIDQKSATDSKQWKEDCQTGRKQT